MKLNLRPIQVHIIVCLANVGQQSHRAFIQSVAVSLPDQAVLTQTVVDEIRFQVDLLTLYGVILSGVGQEGDRLCIAPAFVRDWAAQMKASPVMVQHRQPSIIIPLMTATAVSVAMAGCCTLWSGDKSSGALPYNPEGYKAPITRQSPHGTYSSNLVYRLCQGGECPLPTPKKIAQRKVAVVYEVGPDGLMVPASPSAAPERVGRGVTAKAQRHSSNTSSNDMTQAVVAQLDAARRELQLKSHVYQLKVTAHTGQAYQSPPMDQVRAVPMPVPPVAEAVPGQIDAASKPAPSEIALGVAPENLGTVSVAETSVSETKTGAGARVMRVPKPDIHRGQVDASLTVLFERDSIRLSESAKTSLAFIVEAASKGGHLTVRGGTDSYGAPEVNRLIAARRAEVVKAFLESSGIPTERITVSADPAEYAATNSTPEGRRANRRAEIELTAPELLAKTNACRYIEACFDLAEINPSIIPNGLKTVLRQGDFLRQTLPHTHLNELIASNNDPSISTVLKVLREAGLKLRVEVA